MKQGVYRYWKYVLKILELYLIFFLHTGCTKIILKFIITNWKTVSYGSALVMLLSQGEKPSFTTICIYIYTVYKHEFLKNHTMKSGRWLTSIQHNEVRSIDHSRSQCIVAVPLFSHKLFLIRKLYHNSLRF